MRPIQVSDLARVDLFRSRRGRLASVAILIAVVLLHGGCGERKEPTGATVPQFPVTVDDAEQNLVTLEQAPAAVAMAGSAPVQLATSLGIDTVRIDDGSGNLDLNLIKRRRVDLIVSGSEINRAALSKAKALGSQVYVVADRNLDGIEEAASDLSLLAGKPIRGRLVRARISRSRRKIETALAGRKPVRVFFDAGRMSTVSTGSFIGNIISEAGGLNVAGPDPNEGPFPLKRLVRLRPEILVTFSSPRLTLANLRRDPLGRRLPAIRSGRVVRVEKQLLQPGPEAVVALRILAKAFHPDAFR